MSYSVSVSGHVPANEEGPTVEEREQAIVDTLREAVANIEGVTHAHFSGTTQSTNLLEQDAETPQDTAGAPPADVQDGAAADAPAPATE